MLYEGITILDLTRVFAGPFSTRQFSDYGATVIKIESPAHPDVACNFPPYKKGASGYYETLNRNKSLLYLNIKDPSDLQKFYSLVKEADVVVENFSPNKKYSLGIDYETIKKYNNEIIYASISGYGNALDKKAYDVVIQGECGLINLNGTTQTPMKNATAIIDTTTGLYAAFAISSALFHKQRTGKGQFLDISMMGAGVQLLENNIIDTSVQGKERERSGNQDNVICPFGVFACKDGFVTLAIGNDINRITFVNNFLPEENKQFSTAQERLQNKNTIVKNIELAFSIIDRNEIVSRFEKLGIAGGNVITTKELIKNNYLFEQGYLYKGTHPVLGEYVVPYKAIKFGTTSGTPYTFSPSPTTEGNIL